MGKPRKKTPKPEPAAQLAPDTARPTPQPASAPEVTTNVATLLQFTTDPAVTLPPWPNRRVMAKCPLCGEEHQSPLAYATRVLRRGAATPDEVAWLQAHLRAVGIPA